MLGLLKKVTHASKRSSYRFVVVALGVLLATSSFWFVQQRAEAVRFLDRSLYINSSLPGVSTFYRVSFRYPTFNVVGSVKMLFCTEAIPTLPCDAPVGLNVSAATLSGQTGETGFTLTSPSANSIILTRPPLMTGTTVSSYTFTNVTNPTGPPETFYIRLTSHSSTNGTGPTIDFGSVASTTTQELGIDTQVPPYLVFCTGITIPADCTDPTGPDFQDFEEQEPEQEDTAYTSTEMLAYTNARGGYVVVVTGRSLTSGIYEIPSITDAPEESLPGKGQFGINLTVNNEPAVGAVPTGPGTNTFLNPDYVIPDRFLFNDGDVLVTSNGVTKPRKFTVSYIINVPPDQHPGVYSTTVTFICTGNF
jgi:hypothetical protein